MATGPEWSWSIAGGKRVGAESAEVREAYGSPQGWVTTLNVFAAAIEQDVA
jgi:hypothetical protein